MGGYTPVSVTAVSHSGVDVLQMYSLEEVYSCVPIQGLRPPIAQLWRQRSLLPSEASRALTYIHDGLAFRAFPCYWTANTEVVKACKSKSVYVVVLSSTQWHEILFHLIMNVTCVMTIKKNYILFLVTWQLWTVSAQAIPFDGCWWH